MYEGQWFGGHRSGSGTLYYPGGKHPKYVGQFKRYKIVFYWVFAVSSCTTDKCLFYLLRNMMWGHGVMYKKNGKVLFSGEMKNNKMYKGILQKPV